MIKKAIIYFVLICATTISYGQPKTPTRVILIGLDGFSVAGFKQAKHPNLDKLLREGVVSLNTRTVMPSVTMPNWTSHLTGSGPEQHGVNNNAWTLSKHALPPIATDQDGYYPSIFKVVKKEIPTVKTAFFYNWKELINPFNKRYLDEVYFEENDAYQQSYAKAIDFIKNNRDKPTLTFLYSVHIDHAGHSHGWLSTPYLNAIEEVDVAIGRLIAQLKEADLFTGTHFIFFTDHGGIGTGHGGFTLDEMEVPWSVVGPEIKKTPSLKAPNNNTNTALIIARIFGCKDLPEAWTGKVPRGIFARD
ncbi:alkaline phosphatase family protein [Olivibacter domesticus]|uniref:Type I phosphodiesterase / nucleotide pyrophosphatase n=1 Tax=Olivibacter domesticus TaxID=407022 RepID=A0A1H7K6Q1_OLID1|nr:alkaline phosphatase family protein [Olivibacter domesticus]SEK82509.1 Type I phosphodiesterase / nucleotide pyrophosphatase [Olivibacter domesticus]